MANKKITELTPLPSNMEAGDLFPVVRGANNYKAAFGDLPTALIPTENQIIGDALIELTATGAKAIDFNAYVHGYYKLTGAVILTITKPDLLVGQSVTRTLEIVGNTFGLTLSTDITDNMVGEYDVDKRNFLAITYCYDGTVMRIFANLSNL